jgi:hypothetical protein
VHAEVAMDYRLHAAPVIFFLCFCYCKCYSQLSSSISLSAYALVGGAKISVVPRYG